MPRHPLLQRDRPKFFIPRSESESGQKESKKETEPAAVVADARSPEAEDGPASVKAPSPAASESAASSSEYVPAQPIDVPRPYHLEWPPPVGTQRRWMPASADDDADEPVDDDEDDPPSAADWAAAASDDKHTDLQNPAKAAGKGRGGPVNQRQFLPPASYALWPPQQPGESNREYARRQVEALLGKSPPKAFKPGSPPRY